MRNTALKLIDQRLKTPIVSIHHGEVTKIC